MPLAWCTEQPPPLHGRELPALCAGRECSLDAALAGIWDPFGSSLARGIVLWGQQHLQERRRRSRRTSCSARPGAGDFGGMQRCPPASHTPNPGILSPHPFPPAGGWHSPGMAAAPGRGNGKWRRRYFKPPLWVGDLEKQLREQECEVQPPPLRAGPPSTG